jgi:putative methionine-R-sulfoxide reductase with GAF domain
MPARLTLYPAQRPARVLVIRDGETLVLGREPGCDLVVDEPRVSKRQAQLRWTGAGWALEDLGSKNGTTINSEPARGAELREGDIISLGGLAGRFERITDAQAAALDSQRRAAAEASGPMRVPDGPAPAHLLLSFLEAARELTRTERGFVLVASPDGKLRAETAVGLSPEAVRDERFQGSVGAVRQVLETRASVVLSDVRTDPRLGRRPSVVSSGIASLACIPIRHEGTVLGVIYVDSRKRGPTLSELELETLENMAQHVGAILAEARANGQMDRPSPAADSKLVAELQRRIEQLPPVP